jgi:hypothetical protein
VSRSRLSAAATLLVLAACGAEPAAHEPPPFTVRDSAGVEFVESVRPRWRDGEEWRVAARPRLSIGVADGAQEYVFDRVAGAVRLSDGRIVIGDGTTSELRLYDVDGRFVRRFGRRGQGPGEFRRLAHVRRMPGDTIAGWDSGLGTFAYFDTTGAVLRTGRVDAARVMATIGLTRATERLTPLPDGSFVLDVQQRGNPPERGVPPGVVFRSPVGFYRFHPDGTRVDSLGWRDGGIAQMYMKVGGRDVYATVPVWSVAVVAAGGSPMRIVAGSGDPYRIDEFDADGRLRRVLINLMPPVPIPDSVIEQASALYENRPEHRRVQAAMPRQTHYPAYRDLAIDSDGYVWVPRFGAGTHVYDFDGSLLGSVDGVRGRILDIGRDYILVLTFDEHRVERVALHDLAR